MTALRSYNKATLDAVPCESYPQDTDAVPCQSQITIERRYSEGAPPRQA